MKKYFLYELKKSAFAIAALTLIITCLYSVDLPQLGISYSEETKIWAISLMGGLLAAIVPVWLLSYKMRKRSLDLFYSLPIAHGKILLVKYLIGLIAVFVPYTVAYWVGAVIMTVRFPQNIYGVWYIPQYFASLIPVYLIYAISSFAFTRANKPIDGIVFIVCWIVIIALTAWTLDMRTNHFVGIDEDGYYRYGRYWIEPQLYLPFAPLSYLTSHFQLHVAFGADTHAGPLTNMQLANLIIGFGITTIMAIGATVGLFVAENKFVKAENAEQISNSWFGYKVMIPLFTFCLSAMDTVFPFVIFIAIGAFVASVLYKRTAKIGWKWTAVIAVCYVAGIAASFISF